MGFIFRNVYILERMGKTEKTNRKKENVLLKFMLRKHKFNSNITKYNKDQLKEAPREIIEESKKKRMFQRIIT